jgi:hypothetical protein
MKIKLLLLLSLFLITAKGFSQETVIEIQPQKEFISSVTLAPVCGKGENVELLCIVFWDKKTETLKVDFKNNTNVNKTLFFFPKRMFIKKEIMKLRKNIYFAKEIKKCQFKKTVNAGMDAQKLANVEALSLDAIQTLDLEEKNSSMSFFFNKPFQSTGDIVIPLHLYVASKESSKKARNIKIEYESQLTLFIKKHIETLPSPAPQKETVNCKPLYKANEQLTELLLDIKNSNPSNIKSLKQKYETIKKSVANPEYKKCKDEYKVFENLCSKIDNRLK